jgi:hypothetical protein
MILTHLVMFKFLSGASESGGGGAVTVATYIPTYRPRRR